MDEIFQFLKEKELSSFIFIKCDLEDKNNLDLIFKEHKPKKVINLAAQAGVRYSINNPEEYFKSNMLGFFNILEVSRKNKIKHLVYASTSSVYGDNDKFPLKENFDTSNPLSFYAATKKSNEVMAHSFSNIYNKFHPLKLLNY